MDSQRMSVSPPAAVIAFFIKGIRYCMSWSILKEFKFLSPSVI